MTDRPPCIPLHREILEALERGGLAGDEVSKIVGAVILYLQQTYAGDEIYIPHPARVIPIDDIMAALHSGMSIRAICRRWHIAQKTLYRLIDDE